MLTEQLIKGLAHKVWKNPSLSLINNLIDGNQDHWLRGIIDPHDGACYVSMAGQSTHDQIYKVLMSNGLLSHCKVYDDYYSFMRFIIVGPATQFDGGPDTGDHWDGGTNSSIFRDDEYMFYTFCNHTWKEQYYGITAASKVIKSRWLDRLASLEASESINESKVSRRVFDGMDLSIEHRKGTIRKGTNRFGVDWEKKMQADYGYILKTNSPDGEQLDCYLRASPKSGAKVYVTHLLDGTGKYDEDKVFLGFSSKKEVRKSFNYHYTQSSWGGCSEFDLDHFKVIAFAASSSKVMIADEDTYDEFKKKGRLKAGIRSPIQMAKKVSEAHYFIGSKHTNKIAFDKTFTSLSEALRFYKRLPISDPFQIMSNSKYVSSQALTEGVKAGDLVNIIVPMISLDEYVPKHNDDNIVLAFYVRNEPEAIDPLVMFCDTLPGVAYVDAGDADTMRRTSIIYCELKRNIDTNPIMKRLIKDVLMIGGLSMEDVAVRIPNTDTEFKLTNEIIDLFYEKIVERQIENELETEEE